jgi:hypothetical protein
LILLDAIAHPIQMALHVLFDVRFLRVDLRFQPFQTTVGRRELLAKVFTELIDALAHVMSPVACTTRLPDRSIGRAPETVACGQDAVQSGQCDDLERRDLLCASRSGCRYSWPVPNLGFTGQCENRARVAS